MRARLCPWHGFFFFRNDCIIAVFRINNLDHAPKSLASVTYKPCRNNHREQSLLISAFVLYPKKYKRRKITAIFPPVNFRSKNDRLFSYALG